MFQSAPPHGGRLYWRGPSGPCDVIPVSIRAPARGATARVADMQALDEFQSAPPHGGRPSRVRALGPRSMFQSAPPHGGRPPAASLSLTS